MSRKEKIIRRFLSRPRDFTYDELCVLLKIFGYEEIKTGVTSGSRRAFANDSTGHIIRLHKPHPENTLRMYQVDYILQSLSKQNLL
jgi:hypothetical protein